MKGKKKEPLRTFVFRVSPEDTTAVWRIIELTEKQTLHDFHKILQQSFGFRGKNLYAFYLSGKQWDSETEYGGPSAGTPRKSIKAILEKLELEKGETFRYVLNFKKERWFQIEWIEEETTVPKVSYPRVTEEEGELAPEAPPLEEILPDPLRKWSQKINPVIEIWIATRPKPRGPKDVQQALALLKETQDLLTKSGPEVWHLMEEAAGMLLTDWLLSLPADFTRRGFHDEAIKLCDDFAPFADRHYFLCEKALVFAHRGRKQSALQQIRENLTRFPEDTRVVTKSAEAFWKLEEAGHAERLFRKALDMADDDINDREKILEKLVAMLEENERMEEVVELIRSELDRG